MMMVLVALNSLVEQPRCLTDELVDSLSIARPCVYFYPVWFGVKLAAGVLLPLDFDDDVLLLVVL